MARPSSTFRTSSTLDGLKNQKVPVSDVTTTGCPTPVLPWKSVQATSIRKRFWPRQRLVPAGAQPCVAGRVSGERSKGLRRAPPDPAKADVSPTEANCPDGFE